MLFIIFSQPNDSSLSMSESPRRFANQGLVYLSEIENVADIQDLSVKQAKDILAMNRVNFKGVVEKDELLKHVSRLWKQEKQAQEGMYHIPIYSAQCLKIAQKVAFNIASEASYVYIFE